MQIMKLDELCYDETESFNAKNAKMYQGLPQNASNVGSVWCIGWTPVRIQIDMLRLMFMWRVLLLSAQCTYKIIMIRRMIQLQEGGHGSGPVWNMMVTCHKYGIFDMVYDSVLSSIYMTGREFKKTIRDISQTMNEQACRINCQIYVSLHMLNTEALTCKHNVCCWDVVRMGPEYIHKGRLITRLLFNVFCLGRELCQ